MASGIEGGSNGWILRIVRYFIVGSVILEIVQPLFRTRLENDYKSRGLGSFQDFLNTQPVIHILFHLRHRNANCCKDKINCRDHPKLPLIYCQWNLLYTENPGQRGHNCHCKFTANQVQLNDLDISLAGLILLNCCNLAPADDNAVHKLRRYKNDYLSHNTEGEISETEYKSLWTNLTNFVLQLDPNKQNDLIRIENRPLDEGLCSRYSIDLLNIHKKLNELRTYRFKPYLLQMDTAIHGISSTVHGIDSSIQIDLKSVLNTCWIEIIIDEVMMDDGRLVICVLGKRSLLICNITGSQVAEIPVKDEPLCVTAIDTSTVAVIVKTDYSSYCDFESFFKYSRNNSLCWTSLTDYNMHTLTLPSSPCSMTTLQDGSLYVLCEDGSVHHVSSNGNSSKL
ncbi:unnamed protein product [Mytilus edulis]|uniref:DZIP3-like HEPN domain-containing protein n=1 Tax=Mytilus edulis TaxID=6550 RepID=A0A8S3SVB1_MYTED|nr:unnamed protein product [Mytilus edulis]